MQPRSPTTGLLLPLLLPVLLLWGCGDGTHRSFADARQRLEAIGARSGDAACPEEPACSGILAALAAVPEGHVDHEEAVAILAQVAKARADASRSAPVTRRAARAPALDAPLPDPDEVPAFLGERTSAPRGLAGGGVRPQAGASGETPDAPADEGPDGAGGTAPSEPTGAAAEPSDEEVAALAFAVTAAPAADDAKPGAADPFGGAQADPCAGIRVAIATQEDFLKRTDAERNSLLTVEDDEDLHAMWLLRKLSRCGEHPDDPDCRPLPAETDVDAATPDPRSITRDPGELSAELLGSDRVVQDPTLVLLNRDLAACEAKLRGPTR